MTVFYIFIHFILLFTIYSFIGWACETTLCSIEAKKFINRGFLNGPFCPVYGFGALLIIVLLSPFAGKLPFPGDWILIYVAGVVLTSFLEYGTSVLLEKMFHASWWDYSHRRFNIQGRVCLGNSLLFGVMALFLMELIHPAVNRLIAGFPRWLAVTLGCALAAYFISDCAITVRGLLHLNGKLDQLQSILDEIREKTEAAASERLTVLERALEELKEKSEVVRNGRIAALEASLAELKEKMESAAAGKRAALEQTLENVLDDSVKSRILQLKELQKKLETESRITQRRIMEAFPNMKSIRHPETFSRLKEATQELKERKKRNQKKKQ